VLWPGSSRIISIYYLFLVPYLAPFLNREQEKEKKEKKSTVVKSLIPPAFCAVLFLNWKKKRVK